MNKDAYRRAALHRAAWGIVPPLIRETLSEDSQFRNEHDIISDAVITFDLSSISLRRSELYSAVRKCLSGIEKVVVSDTHDKKWGLKNIGKEGELPKLEMHSDTQRLILPDFIGLSPDVSIRLRYLDEMISNVNLPSDTQAEWRSVLLERALEDEEMDSFYRECRNTPVEKAKSIRGKITEGNISITVPSLVPASRRYYERLIGVICGSASINEYAISGAKNLFERLSSWRPYDGFLFSLLLSSHSAITAEISVDQLESKDIVCAFESVEIHGDVISQLGAIEVGLRVLEERPEIESVLIRLIKKLRDDDANAQNSGYNLISALFILVDGEFSRTRLFTKEPPFYRRLAALSQAALIYRQIINSNVASDQLCEWALSNFGGKFYIQSLADMRIEPCWSPDFASASQIKADFLGRIVIAAGRCEKNIKQGELYDLLFGTNPDSIPSLCEFPSSYYPGPLEGIEDTPKILPVEIAKMIETQLCSEEVTAKSFIALVNSAMIFRVGTDQAELAAKTLKLGSYRLTKIESRSQLLAILQGLATVAAITRSHALADELRILTRIYRRDPQYALSTEEIMMVCLVAAASHKDPKEWGTFIGDWLTELAFSDLEGNDGEVLHSPLQWLCHVAPDLWVFCGRAEAALVAYNARSC